MPSCRVSSDLPPDQRCLFVVVCEVRSPAPLGLRKMLRVAVKRSRLCLAKRKAPKRGVKSDQSEGGKIVVQFSLRHGAEFLPSSFHTLHFYLHYPEGAEYERYG